MVQEVAFASFNAPLQVVWSAARYMQDIVVQELGSAPLRNSGHKNYRPLFNPCTPICHSATASLLKSDSIVESGQVHARHTRVRAEELD